MKPALFSSSGHCEITEVTKVEGEAIANNRKAKLIFFYELVVEAEWKGNKFACSSDLLRIKSRTSSSQYLLFLKMRTNAYVNCSFGCV